jgi:hypothetical protein
MCQVACNLAANCFFQGSMATAKQGLQNRLGRQNRSQPVSLKRADFLFKIQINFKFYE